MIFFMQYFLFTAFGILCTFQVLKTLMLHEGAVDNTVIAQKWLNISISSLCLPHTLPSRQ